MPNPLSFRDLARARSKSPVKARLREAEVPKPTETFINATYDGKDSHITLKGLGIYSFNDNETLSGIEDNVTPHFGSRMNFSSDGNFLFIPAPSLAFDKFNFEEIKQESGVSDGQQSQFENNIIFKATGAVLVFKRFENDFKHVQTLSAFDANPFERFGTGIAYDESSGILAVGGPCIESAYYNFIFRSRIFTKKGKSISNLVPRSLGHTHIYKLSSDSFHFVQRLSGHQGGDLVSGQGSFGQDVAFKNGFLDITQTIYQYDPAFVNDNPVLKPFGQTPNQMSLNNTVPRTDGLPRVFSYIQTLSDGKFQYVKKTPNNDIYNLRNDRWQLSGEQMCGLDSDGSRGRGFLYGKGMVYNGNVLFMQSQYRYGSWNGALENGAIDSYTMTKSANGEFSFLGGKNVDYTWNRGSFIENMPVFRNVNDFLVGNSSNFLRGFSSETNNRSSCILIDPFIDERNFFVSHKDGNINSQLLISKDVLRRDGQNVVSSPYNVERNLLNGYVSFYKIDDNLYGQDNILKFKSQYSIGMNKARYRGQAHIKCFSPDKEIMIMAQSNGPNKYFTGNDYIEIFKKVNGKYEYQTTVYDDLLQQFLNSFNTGLLFGNMFAGTFNRLQFCTVSNKLPNGTRKLYVGNDRIRTYTLTEVDNREKIFSNALQYPHYFTTSSVVLNISANDQDNFINGEGLNGSTSNPTLSVNVYANYDFLVNSSINFAIRNNINDESEVIGAYGNNSKDGISNEKIMWTPKIPGTYYYVNPNNLETFGKIEVLGQIDDSYLYRDWKGERKIFDSPYSNTGSTPPAPRMLDEFLHNPKLSIPEYLDDEITSKIESSQTSRY